MNKGAACAKPAILQKLHYRSVKFLGAAKKITLHSPWSSPRRIGLYQMVLALDYVVGYFLLAPILHQGNFKDLESMSLKEIRKEALDRIEKQAISYVLEKTGWNRSKASKILKISYKTLLYKISDLNIIPPNS